MSLCLGPAGSHDNASAAAAARLRLATCALQGLELPYNGLNGCFYTLGDLNFVGALLIRALLYDHIQYGPTICRIDCRSYGTLALGDKTPQHILVLAPTGWVCAPFSLEVP